jgi:hypothetical protein
MTPEFWADNAWRIGELVVGAATIYGSWIAMRNQVEKANEKVADLEKGRDHDQQQFETFEQAMRKRLEDGDRKITVLETTQNFHARELERGLGRIEGSLAAITANMQAQFQQMHDRLAGIDNRSRQ